MQLIEDYLLIGPNRRSEKTVNELWLQAGAEESAALDPVGSNLQQALLDELAGCGFELPAEHPLRDDVGGTPVERFALRVGGVALALQQRAGHRVGFLSCGPASQPGRCWLAVEHEEQDTGIDACGLALHLVSDLAAGVELTENLVENYRGFAAHLDEFLAAAVDKVLPRDAQAIIDAAARLDVPCVKLDREPYQGVSGDFRIRRNGLLKLGHACHQRLVDGTFPIDSKLASLLQDREAVCRGLDFLGLPKPRHAGGICISSRHALQAAEQIGYPVALRPRLASRVKPCRAPWPLADAASLLLAAEQALQNSPGVLVEAWVPGRAYKILLAAGEIVAVIELEHGVGVADVTARAAPETLALARQASGKLECPLLALTVVCPDIAQTLAADGVFVNLDVAPELDAFLPETAPFAAQAIMDRAAEGLVRHLFPAGAPSRIPLAVVTGTNGKTTTSALIARVMQNSGLVTGRAGTTGVFIDGELLEPGDLSGGSGHHRVLESPDVQCGVLETARGSLTQEGLMFDGCDVSVFTNVSPDHLGLRGIDTVEQMAELKEFIVQRARDAIVLNADDEFSIAMLPRIGDRQPWVVSARIPGVQLLETYGKHVNYCVAENNDGQEWINLYQGGRREPLMAVDAVPITFRGRVRYNVSNTLQAIAACRQLGVASDTIRSAVAGFTPSFEDSPGRMNIFRGARFTVILDYAHNEAGHAQVGEFLRTMEVPGRRILHFAASGAWSDEAIMSLGRTVAGFYDFYICRNYPTLLGRQPGEVGSLLKKGLEQAGVPAAASVVMQGDDMLEQGLRLCREGDLMVYAASIAFTTQEWETITNWPAN